MSSLRLSPLALQLGLVFSGAAISAEPATDAAADATAAVEVMHVSGKKLAYANNIADEQAKQFKSPLGSVMDLVTSIPGINVGQGDVYGADDYTTVINMRGFVIDRADQQLGITIDGIPNGGSAYAGGSKANRYLDAETTAYVEVGQGAADIGSASLDALGGTLNFVSARPEAEAGLQFAHTQGSFNGRRDFVRYDTGDLGGNTLAYVSLSNSFNNRWIGSGSNGHADRLHAEVKTVTELEHAKITARVSFDDTAEDNYQPISLAQFQEDPSWDRLTWQWTGNPDIDQNYAETWSTLRENTLASVKTEWSLSDDLELVVTPYFHKQKGRGDWLPPYMHYPVNAAGEHVSSGNVSTTRFYYVDAQGRPLLDATADTSHAKRVASYRHTHYDKDRFGALAEARYRLDSQQFRVGLWLEQQDRRQTRDWHQVIDTAVSYHYNQTPYWTQFDDDYRNSVLKYFVQDQITLGEATVTLGLQQYLVDVERTDRLNGRGHDKLNSDSDLLPSAGVVYPLNAQLEVFAGYSRNFKAISDKLLESKTAAELDELEPETADNLDVGVRYSGDALNLSATLYRAVFDNRIALLTYQTNPDGTPNYDAVGDGNFDNVGGVESKGFEGSASYQLSPQWQLDAGLTLNRSTYSDDVLGLKNGADGKPVEVKEYKADQKVAGSPERMANLGLSYHTDSLMAGLKARYIGSYYGAAKHSFVDGESVWNRDRLPQVTLWDFNVGYQRDLAQSDFVKGMELNFVINNLTDKAYLSGGSEGAYLLGAGRSASMTVRLQF